MAEINKEPRPIRKVLATDLDGTLIPLPDLPENKQALDEIRKASTNGQLLLIFCTGRHFDSVTEAMDQYDLPFPEWIICDVGTSIYRHSEGQFLNFGPYEQHLDDLTLNTSREEMESILEGLPGLVMQQENHQQRFKLSYECATGLTDGLVEQIAKLLKDFRIPYGAHGSIDPFLNCGLIDLLPEGVSKAYALKWLAGHAGYQADQVVYAGDSGNDFSALTSGCRAIVVANASEGLAKKVKKTLKEKKKSYALYTAKEKATSGVFEGCQHFEWI